MALFKRILNGKMKFYPQYELKAIGYQIVPLDFNGSLIVTTYTSYLKGYQLNPVSEGQKRLK